MLVSMFYHQGYDLGFFDIGPSIGIAPNLVIYPDGKINFEDLSTFTQMWHWNNANLNTYNMRYNSASVNNNYWDVKITHHNQLSILHLIILYYSIEIYQSLI